MSLDRISKKGEASSACGCTGGPVASATSTRAKHAAGAEHAHATRTQRTQAPVVFRPQSTAVTLYMSATQMSTCRECTTGGALLKFAKLKEPERDLYHPTKFRSSVSWQRKGVEATVANSRKLPPPRAENLTVSEPKRALGRR